MDIRSLAVGFDVSCVLLALFPSIPFHLISNENDSAVAVAAATTSWGQQINNFIYLN